MDAALDSLGSFLAYGYIYYAAFFLVMACVLGANITVFLLCLVPLFRRQAPGRRSAWAWLPIELIFGLFHPLVYLTVLQQVTALEKGEFRPVMGICEALPDVALFTALGWIALALFWGLRLAGGPSLRWTTRCVCAFCMTVVAAFFVKDLAAMLPLFHDGAMRPYDTNDQPLLLRVFWIGILLLYAIPVLILAAHLRLTWNDAIWNGGARFLLFSRRTGRCVAGAATGLAVVVFLVLSIGRSDATVESLVLARREPIQAAATSYRVDPGVVAAIAYVTQRDETSAFRSHLERLGMDAWLVDERSHAGLSRALDFSIGFCQIKPVTALTALTIDAAASGALDPSWVWPKCYPKGLRDVPDLGDAWRLPAGSTHAPPGFGRGWGGAVKKQVVAALHDDARNVELCAFILSLYAAQWEAAYPGWSIRDRPDILATLYQIGFQRSVPKPDPRSNDFGRRVLAVYQSPFIAENFPERAGVPSPK